MMRLTIPLPPGQTADADRPEAAALVASDFGAGRFRLRRGGSGSGRIRARFFPVRL